MKVKAVPVNIHLSWGMIEGLHWSRPGLPRVLCLHGWLDNAASFVPLSSYLQDFDVLALDFAGHGFSSHRPETSRYYHADYLFDVDEALSEFGWDNCHLIGHSMGGGVACNFSAAAPERVNRLVTLDAVGGLNLSPDETTMQLRASLQSVRKRRSQLKPYDSVEHAMAARQKKSQLSDTAARLLCERALEHTGDYFQWRTDPRLNWRSPLVMTNEQVLNLLSGISAPTLVMTSSTGTEYLGSDLLRKRIAALADCEHVTNNGHHHFHMDQPQETGACITEFLLRQGSEPHTNPCPGGDKETTG